MKRQLCSQLSRIGVDRVFRYLNRHNLLVVMYHGVTCQHFDPPVWTQLPVSIFREQMEFLATRYRPVSLGEMVAALAGGKRLPDRSVLVTFDDGLRNNYTTAFPILSEFRIPAAIFLTVDLLGTGATLWFDELFILMEEAFKHGVDLELPGYAAARSGDTVQSYRLVVEEMKRLGAARRREIMQGARGALTVDYSSRLSEFELLDWDEVVKMQESGLVEFGVHTATHQILTDIADCELENEVIAPKKKLQEMLGVPVRTFCYPNGRPGKDFTLRHRDFLRQAGYVCAFSTENSLVNFSTVDAMALGRVPAGNDLSSEKSIFNLSSSGALGMLRSVRSRLGFP